MSGRQPAGRRSSTVMLHFQSAASGEACEQRELPSAPGGCGLPALRAGQQQISEKRGCAASNNGSEATFHFQLSIFHFQFAFGRSQRRAARAARVAGLRRRWLRPAGLRPSVSRKAPFAGWGGRATACFCSRLIRIFGCAEDTLARQNASELAFALAYPYLCPPNRARPAIPYQR